MLLGSFQAWVTYLSDISSLLLENRIGYTLRVAPTGNDMSVGVRELDVCESKGLAN
jgi:hypothetical protein